MGCAAAAVRAERTRMISAASCSAETPGRKTALSVRHEPAGVPLRQTRGNTILPPGYPCQEPPSESPSAKEKPPIITGPEPGVPGAASINALEHSASHAAAVSEKRCGPPLAITSAAPAPIRKYPESGCDHSRRSRVNPAALPKIVIGSVQGRGSVKLTRTGRPKRQDRSDAVRKSASSLPSGAVRASSVSMRLESKCL